MTSTASDHRQAAAAADAEVARSFADCDTDGFVSQWAGGLTARVHRANADLLDAGGTREVPALFDTAGNLVAAKLIATRYGMSWGLLASDDPGSRIVGWLNPSQARSEATRKAKDAAKGYRVGSVMAPSKAKIMGSGTGLSGATSCYVGYYRTDGGFSRDVQIVSDGS
jgi:hypothetical protein